VSDRNLDDLMDYLAKAGYIAREIGADRFYKRRGMWCAWCDYLPVCLRDERKTAETLVRVNCCSRSVSQHVFALLAFSLC
jgi:hypothetical protein